MTIEELKTLLKQVEEQHLDLSILDMCFASKCERHVWDNMSRSQEDLTDQFVLKYKDWLNWTMLSTHHKFSIQLLNKVEDKIDWSLLSRNEHLTVQIIRCYKDKINFKALYNNVIPHTFNIDFMREFKDDINFSYIIKNYKIDMNMIKEFKDEFKDKSDWMSLSRWQKINKPFVWRNLEKLDLGSIYKYQRLGKELKDYVKQLMNIKKKIEECKIK